MFDTELTQKVADITAEEARAKYNAYTKYDDRDIYKGLTFWAPNINIFRDPRWGRGHETYGEDPYLTAENGKAFVNGLQGEGKTMKAAACAKHYAVHSGPEAVRHEFNAEVSKKDIEETYLPALDVYKRQVIHRSYLRNFAHKFSLPCTAYEILINNREIVNIPAVK